MTQQFHSWVYTQEKWKHMLTPNLHVNAHGGIIHSSQKVERNWMSISRWDKYNVVCPCKGKLFGHEKEGSADTCYNMDKLENVMLSERSQAQRITYCVITFLWNGQKRQLHKDRKQIRACQRLRGRGGNGGRTREMMAKQYRVSF